MARDIGREVAALRRLTVGGLRAKYADVFGEGSRTWNRDWLVRRIAWRLQAETEGGLSERARQRAAELANEADLRTSPPKAPRAGKQPVRAAARLPADGRLPPPGTVLARPYKGGVVEVTVLADGLEFAGARYRSLSGVAKAATGSHCNGFAFFGLAGKGGGR